MKQKQLKVKPEDTKGPISARIDKPVIAHCTELANSFNWSLAQVIQLAMKNITREDILKTFENEK